MTYVMNQNPITRAEYNNHNNWKNKNKTTEITPNKTTEITPNNNTIATKKTRLDGIRVDEQSSSNKRCSMRQMTWIHGPIRVIINRGFESDCLRH